MSRLFLLVSIPLFLISCNNSVMQVEDNLDIQQNTFSTQEMNSFVVTNIVASMGLDLSIESPFRRSLEDIQGTCIGGDFIRYRECFIEKLKNIKSKVTYTSQEEKNFSLLLGSIEKEKEYYSYYKIIDGFDYPDKDTMISTIGKDCYFIATGSIQRRDSTMLYNPENVSLSYSSDVGELLIATFPSWSGSQMYDSMSYTGRIFDQNHPCLYRTFGPTIGNIIYATSNGDNTYLFIKDADGGGSGEFSYVIFVYNKSLKSLISLGNMWSWSGIYPFDYNMNLEKQQKHIIETYRNRIFLYSTYFDRQWVTGNTVESLMQKYTK